MRFKNTVAKSLIVLIVLGIAEVLPAQDLVYDRFFKPLYQFNLVEAERVVKKDSVQIPKQDLQVLKIHLNWWKLISGYSENEGFLDQSYDLLEKHINDLESATHECPTHKRCQLKLLNAYSVKSRIQLLDENYFSALKDLRKCILLLEQLNETEHESEELKLVNAIYDYYHEYAYENYFLLRPILLNYHMGSMQRGLNNLKVLAKKGNWAIAAEANYFLAKIYLESEENARQSLVYSRCLMELYPNNLIYKLKYAKALKRVADKDEFLKFCQTQISHVKQMRGISNRTEDHFVHMFSKIQNE